MLLSGGVSAEGARAPASRLDHRLDEARFWDYCLRNWHRTPLELEQALPYWMLECLTTIANVRAEIEEERREE